MLSKSSVCLVYAILVALSLFAFHLSGTHPNSSGMVIINQLDEREDAQSPDYFDYYRRTGRKFDVNWKILAAIGYIESNHNQSPLPGVESGLNSAECCAGPMQICVITSCGDILQTFAVDGNNDQIIDIYHPADAIFTAGNIIAYFKAELNTTNPSLLLAAYNAGDNSVENYQGVPPFPETENYVHQGLAYIQSLR